MHCGIFDLILIFSQPLFWLSAEYKCIICLHVYCSISRCHEFMFCLSAWIALSLYLHVSMVLRHPITLAGIQKINYVQSHCSKYSAKARFRERVPGN